MKKKANINILLNKPVLEYEKFHELTKFKKLPRNTNSRFWPKEWKTVYYKGYSRFKEVTLPRPKILKLGLQQAIAGRESTRWFSREAISDSDISTMLYRSAGIKSPKKNNRFYPSAGGRYPLEIYLISLNSTLPKGIYHYYVKNNSLERLADFKKADVKKYFNLPWVSKSGCLIILTAVFKRTTVKYGERGYRHVLVEAGHMAQNFYLLATALNLSCCAIGGYTDQKINNLLDIDGINETVVYVFAAGKPLPKS